MKWFELHNYTCPECGGNVIEGTHADMCESCDYGVRYSY